MTEVFLLAGGNMGDRLACLSMAEKAIAAQCGHITRKSGIYETAAWGKEDQSAFLNQVLCLETRLEPYELLQKLLDIEEQMGRKRQEKYGPRLIDIDILLYGNAVIDRNGLQVPHPQMRFRRFVLVPLAELAADNIHPVLNKRIADLLAECNDPLPVHKFN